MKVHLGKKVIDYNTQGEWKIQLSMTVNFIMRTKSDNTEIIIGDEIDNSLKELFASPFAKIPRRIRTKNEKIFLIVLTYWNNSIKLIIIKV